MATRLMTLARPDALVSVNGGSRKNLALVTGFSAHRIQQPAGYEELLQWVLDQPWWSSKRPKNSQEARARDARAALVDCFAHHDA